MRMQCDKCEDHLWHVHCEKCGQFMAHQLEKCPKCSTPVQEVEKASLPWWIRN